MKFFKCGHCGNIIAYVEDKGVPVVCCGEKMQELIPGAQEAAVEKHIPVYTVDGAKVSVTVGSVEHPMTPEHFIGWVALETQQGNQRKALQGAPKAEFMLCEDDAVVAVYAWCNLHGLWKA